MSQRIDGTTRWQRLAAFALAFLILTGGVHAATSLTAETRGTVPVGASGGPLVGVTADRADLTDFSINNSAARVTTSDGTIVVDGQDDAYVRADQINGTWTNVSNADTNGGEITLDPIDKQPVTFDGGIDGLRWQSTANTVIDDGEVDFWYNASSDGNVTIRGLPADTDVAAISDDTTVPEIKGRTTTDATGEATFELKPGKHEIRIRETPGTLYIRNESNPSELVTGTATNPVEVEIRFYLGDATDSPNQIITRSTTDGTVNMTGLPKNESFVVVADAAGYEPRRIYVGSLLQQEDIYLLPESTPSVQKLYQLTDYTGLYPQEESVLQIQRGINGSWETVQGDFFGATGEFEAVLAQNTRHRLLIVNTETGNRRVLGRVTPLNTGTSEVEIQSRNDISLNRIGPLISVLPSTRALPAAQTDVTVGVKDAGATVDSWNYTITLKRDDGTTQTLASATKSGAGEASPSFDLTNETGTVVVEVGWRSADGRTMVDTIRYRVVPMYDGYSLLDGLSGFEALFASDTDAAAATSMIALLTSVFGSGVVALKLRASTEGIGLTAVGILALWSIIGWVSYAVVFAGAVAWTALVAIRRGL